MKTARTSDPKLTLFCVIGAHNRHGTVDPRFRRLAKADGIVGRGLPHSKIPMPSSVESHQCRSFFSQKRQKRSARLLLRTDWREMFLGVQLETNTTTWRAASGGAR